MSTLLGNRVESALGQTFELADNGMFWKVCQGEVDVFAAESALHSRMLLTTVRQGELLPDCGWPAGRVLAICHPDTILESISITHSIHTNRADPHLSKWISNLTCCFPEACKPNWNGNLSHFHHAILNACEMISARKKARGDTQIAEWESQANLSIRSVSSRLAAVLDTGLETIETAKPSSDPLIACIKIALGQLGMSPKIDSIPPSGDPDRQMLAASRAGNFRFRKVHLAEKWWEQDSGPMIAFRLGVPVALIPSRSRRYESVDAHGDRDPVTPETSSNFDSHAFCLYPGFKDGPIGVRDLVLLGWNRSKEDLGWIAATSILIGLLGTVGPWLTGQIFDFVIPLAERNQMMTIATALFAVTFGSVLFEVARGIGFLRIETRIGHYGEAALWDRLLRLPATFFRRYSSGDLASRTTVIRSVETTLSRVGHTVLLGAPTSLFNLIVMFYYDWRLSWLGVGLALCGAAVIWWFNASQIQDFQKQRALVGPVFGKLQSMTYNLIRGIPKLRACGAENFAFGAWAQLFAADRKMRFNRGRWGVMERTLLSGFPLFTSIWIFIFVAAQVSNQPTHELEHRLTMGAFIAFNAAFGSLVAAFCGLASATLQLNQASRRLFRMQPIFETSPETDGSQINPGQLSGMIEVKNASFRFFPDSPWVVSDLSFHVKPGEFIAIVGPSGSGKSTILRLLLGFERPQSGKVFYDQQDLQSLDPREVRRQIGTVLQTSRLMTGDIFRNIVGDSDLTIKDAWEAAEAAGVADDIRSMPMGMFTMVGDGGGQFSGGQRQRILIARAIARKPRIFLFDEATSALDNRTQAIVAKSLENIDATRIVIAHRLSTIRNADRILVLDSGRFVAEGAFEALQKSGGLFQQLIESQIPPHLQQYVPDDANHSR